MIVIGIGIEATDMTFGNGCEGKQSKGDEVFTQVKAES